MIDEQDDIISRLDFFKKLQSIANKIHSTYKIDQIMLDLSKGICKLFDCERLTLYVVNDKKDTIESKIKTGLNSFKDFALPISEKSIAGYVALTQQSLNILNVYDQAELASYSPGLEFLQKVDQRTGYRTKQMLVAPLVNAETGELLGVLQLINNREETAFSELMEEGLKDLCETLAVAFFQRMKPLPATRTKYDSLVSGAILSVQELDLAARAARRKGVDIEEILVDEFQVTLSEIGESLANFFDVYYEPYHSGRIKPDALKNFKRAYVEHNHWLVVQETDDSLIVMATDPDRIMGSRVVHTLFPKMKVNYCVTTHREFKQTVVQFFGIADYASPEDGVVEDVEQIDQADLRASENALIQRINVIIADAFSEHGKEISVEQRPRNDKTVSRFHKDGSLQRMSGQVIVDFHVHFPAPEAN